MDDDRNVDADTSLSDLDMSRLNNINVDTNTAKIDTSSGDGPSLFAANNLYRKNADNLAIAEAMVDDEPLRTKKTEELERKEAEDKEE